MVMFAGAAVGGLGQILGQIISSVILAAALTSLQNPLNQFGNRLFPILPVDIGSLIRLRMRGEIELPKFYEEMEKQGIGVEASDAVFKAAQFFPSPQDLVTWQAREVFEPESVVKFGLDTEFEELDLTLFGKAGVNDEQARNFWRAHWQHPPFNQVAEMLARDILTDVGDRDTVEPGSSEWAALREKGRQELFEWYRLVEIPTHWRDRLTRLSEQLVTRVDARRMFDMGTIDETRMLRLYLDLRYNEQDAKDLTLWSKVNRDFPDLIQRYGKGWIKSEEVKQELLALGMPEERAQILLETRIQNLARPLRVERERDLTKSEIVKGVKNEIISLEVGVGLLEQMGFDTPEAEFIMAINIEADSSPETPLEFEWLVQGYRQSIGKTAKPIPLEVIRLGRELRQAATLLAEAVASGVGADIQASLSAEKGRVESEWRRALNTAGLLDAHG